MSTLDDAVLDEKINLGVPVSAIKRGLKILGVKEENGHLTLDYKQLGESAIVQVMNPVQIVKIATGLAIIQEVEFRQIPLPMWKNTENLMAVGLDAYFSYKGQYQ